MAEKHWCKEHKTVWFKTQYGYGHPILDEEGNPVLNDEGKQRWCREPKEKALSATESPERQASIEIQNAYTGVISLMVSGVIKKTDLLGQTAINYAASKLSRWASMGEVEKPQESKEKMIQPEQIERIKAAAQKYKDDTKAYLKVMQDAYEMTNYKKLNQLQAEDFIKRLESGEGLKLGEIEPDKLPV